MVEKMKRHAGLIAAVILSIWMSGLLITGGIPKLEAHANKTPTEKMLERIAEAEEAEVEVQKKILREMREIKRELKR